MAEIAEPAQSMRKLRSRNGCCAAGGAEGADMLAAATKVSLSIGVTAQLHSLVIKHGMRHAQPLRQSSPWTLRFGFRRVGELPLVPAQAPEQACIEPLFLCVLCGRHGFLLQGVNGCGL